jgi:alkylhydroperoxidase family enzyme
MMRIEGISKSKVSFFVRLAFWFSQRRFGKVADPLRITGHHPWVSFGYGIFELAGERAHLVESRVKDLAQIKAATRVGCPFWIDIGSAVGRAAGITEEQLRELSAYKESRVFSPLEKRVLDYAEAMTLTPVEVPDELFATLREHFNEAQLVELTAAIAWENYRGRFNHAFGIEAQGFSAGSYCLLPERTREIPAGHNNAMQFNRTRPTAPRAG